MAPRTPVTDSDIPNAEALGRSAAHMAMGGNALGIFHTIRGMMGMLPESYRQELATGLLPRDPDAILAMLGEMRQAGADLQDIRRLAGGMATLLGGDASAVAAPQGVRNDAIRARAAGRSGNEGRQPGRAAAAHDRLLRQMRDAIVAARAGRW